MRISDASTGDPSISCDSIGILSDETSANQAELRAAPKQTIRIGFTPRYLIATTTDPKEVLHTFTELMNRKGRAKPNVGRADSPRLVARHCNVDCTHSTRRTPRVNLDGGRLKVRRQITGCSPQRSVVMGWKPKSTESHEYDAEEALGNGRRHFQLSRVVGRRALPKALRKTPNTRFECGNDVRTSNPWIPHGMSRVCLFKLCLCHQLRYPSPFRQARCTMGGRSP